MIKTLLPLLLVVTSSLALADTRVPGTYTYYSYKKDAITDVNTSVASIDELYDQDRDTILFIRCANGSRADLWSYLLNKNDLMTAEEAQSEMTPRVILRLGTDTPINVAAESLYVTTNADDEPDTRAIGFDARTTRAVVNGLLSGKKVVIRVNRTTGGQPLTFTFPAAGFTTAWNAIKQCK